jgi:iron(III) transport system substrate-binding protein
MPDPCSHETTLSWLVGLKEAVFPSEAAWMAFLQGLARNRPLFVPSFGSTPQPIESGEKWIGISLPKYIITRAPAPLDWAPRDQPLFGTPRGIAVASSAPHADTARLFVTYWLSEEAMTLLARRTGEYVLAPGVHPPIPGMEKARVRPLRELSPEEIGKWRDVFRKVFHPPSAPEKLRGGGKTCM